jgi:hypothetical protein
MNNTSHKEDGMRTIRDFVTQNGITIKVERADSNKNAPDWKDANHYKVTLKMAGKQLTTYFSQGYGINGEPKASSVLDCLASDAAGYENARDFEDWASEYGYDTDSRKAEKMYKVIGKQADKLKLFLGENLYDSLLWNTERE